MPMISYRCPDCGSDDEHFHHSASNAPDTIECRGFKVNPAATEKVERRIAQPDGTYLIEWEEVELAPTLSVCTGTSYRRVSYPGELTAAPARGFEPLVIFERVGYESYTPEQKRSLQRYYIPGRNYEPTEPGMKRIEITSMAQYNAAIREINRHEVSTMSDHRAMHAEYWKSRRRAMRDHVDARIRHSPLLVSLARLIRARSDRKTNTRYGKPLNANFHAQLLEFNQGNIQDFCDADTGWRSRRA